MTRAARLPESLEQLEAWLHYKFRDPALLAQALTHRSRRNKDGSATTAVDNERLEFLGDAILGFVVSDLLYTLFPALSEGQLSRIKANVVNARHLRQVAERLELGRYLRLGRGEEKTGGRQKQVILANSLEALVAALYRDGGLEPARAFVEEFVVPELRESDVEFLTRADYKSALQEYLQEKRLPAPRYRMVDARGPEHRKTFTIELWVGERFLGRGEGLSRKAAEQQAARRGLEQLPIEGEHS